MVQTGNRLGFRQIGVGIRRGTDEAGMWHFDGHIAPELVIACQKDFAESALAQRPFNLITANPGRVRFGGRLLSRRSRIPRLWVSVIRQLASFVELAIVIHRQGITS